VWANGGEASGHIPARYPKTELSDDDALRLSRKTDWLAIDGDFSVGLGQRILTTDTEEIPLLGCGIIDLQTATAASAG
jgi:type VI secretion system protein ImpE